MTTSVITTPTIPTDWLKRRLDLLKDVSTGRVFTPEEAKIELDVDLEPDWTVKIVKYEPAESGFAFVQITPEGWELFPDDTQVSPEGWSFTNIIRGDEGEVLEYQATSPEGQVFTKDELEEASLSELDLYKRLREQDIAGTLPEARREEFEALRERALATPEVAPTLPVVREDMAAVLEKIYPEMFKPEDSFGLTPEESQGIVALAIRDFAQQDPEGFIADLFERGASEEDVRVILDQMGAPGEFTSAAIGRISFVRIEQAFNKVFPTVANVDQAMNWIQQDAENERNFLLRVRQIGRNEDTENLLRALYPGQEDEIFGRVFPEAPEIIALSEEQIDDAREVMLSDEGMPAEDFESLVGMTIQEYSVARLEGRISGRGFIKPGESLEDRTTPDGKVVLKIEGKATSRWELFGETVIRAAGAPLFTIAGVGISAADIAALALIGLGIQQVGSAGWNKLLDRVLKKPGDLNFLGKRLTEAGLNRNLNLLERQRGIKIPPATRKAFIDKYLEDMAASWARNVAGQGKTITPQALQIASQDAYAATANAVNRELLVLIPRGTQTGAVALGGLPAKPTIQSVVGKIATQQPLTPAEEQFRVNNAQAVEDALATRVPPAAVTPKVPATEAIGGLKKGEFVRLQPEGPRHEITGITRNRVALKDEAGNIQTIPSTTQVFPSVIPEVPVTEPGAPEAGLQPSMLPEEISAKEVRPPSKGEIVQISMDDQLKLDKARLDAEAAIEDKVAYEAQAEAEGLKAYLDTEPASKLTNLIKKTGWHKGEIKDLTLKQYRDLTGKAPKPSILTKDKKHVRWEFALDDIATELGYADSEILKAEIERAGGYQARIKELDALIKTHFTEKPLLALPEVKPTEIALSPTGEKMLTPAQVTRTLDLFGKYVNNPSTVNAWELTRELRREARTASAEKLKARAQELIVEQGKPAEEAMNQAIRETLAGELPAATTDYLSDLTNQMRATLFSKVYETLKDEPFEMASTLTALTNALDGRAIPRDPGVRGGSAFTRLQRVFGEQPQVMKALDTVAKEHKPLEDIVQGIYREIGQPFIPVDQQMADYLRKLSIRPLKQSELGQAASEIVEALRLNEVSKLGEIPSLLSEIPSLPVDTRTPGEKDIDLQNFKLEIKEEAWGQWTPEQIEQASYLRTLADRPEAILTMIEPLALEPGVKPSQAEIYQALNVSDLRTASDIQFAQAELELGRQFAEGKLTFDEFQLKRLEARDKAYPSTPVTRYDAPIDKAFKIPPMFNFLERSTFNRVLKELLWAPLDIGNFLRANKASFDNSFLRQSKILISGHPIVAWQAHSTAWQSMFSQKHTEAEWELITRDPDFQIYEQIRVDTGHDPLRVPAFAATKGTEQYRTSEEFGFTRQDVERAIPRFTAWLPHVKYSERAFSAGTNKTVWRIWKQKLKFSRRYAEKIASGDIVLKEGEAFNIIQEMTDQQSMLGDMIQRANLRRFSGLAPAINAFFFAARSKIGRLLLPKHLIGFTIRDGKAGFNPRVMKEAWRDFFLWTGYISGIMFLGDWLDLWDLEKDPRNAEFMSARIGKTRIDPWAGYRQFAVLYSRLVTRTGISSVTGAEYDIDPLKATQSFVTNSLSPLGSILLEFWTGRNFLGQVIDYDDAKYWIEKITPFSINDVWEAAEEDWRMGIAVTIPAVYGEGVQTYTGDWEENFTKLGLPKYIENTAYDIPEPYYDTADFWSDTAGQFRGIDPATLTAAKGFPDYIRAIAETRIVKENLATMPNERLVSLNADPSEGTTFTQYYQMWADREKLVASGDEDKLKKFDQDERTSNAHLGNFSQRQFALLNEYWSITDPKKQAEFLKEHEDEIGVKPRDEWLRSNPKENAQLAVWGQAKILTKEAYDEFNRLIKSLDIPDNAIPALTLPPETSIDTHFTYEEMVSEGTHSSVEADLLLLKDHLAAEEADVESYVDWRTRSGEPLTLSEESVEYLQLRVDNQDLFDALKEAQDIPTKAERDVAVVAVRATKVGNETFLDIERRVDAMGKGTREAPIPEEIVNAYVGHMQIVDETSGLSAEAKLNRFDDPALNEYLMNEDYHGKQKAKPLDEDQEYLVNYLVPRWRFEVEYREEDEEYNALVTTSERQEYLSENEDYRMDRRRREALEMTNTVTGDRLPIDQVENFVDYWELPVRGKRQERFLIDNPEFSKAMHNIAGIDIPKPADVPAVQFDDIYDKWQPDFDKLEGLSDNKSEHYIEDPAQRDRARDTMRFNEDGKYTEFGLAEIRRNAYGKLVPTGHIDNFVGYYTIIGEGKPEDYPENTPWWEDDWFLIENEAFYIKVYKGILENEERDFSKVPTRAIGAKYIHYKGLKTQLERDQYRIDNPELDQWGVSIGIWAITMSDRRKALGITPSERFQEGLEQEPGELKRKLEELEKESEIKAGG